MLCSVIWYKFSEVKVNDQKEFFSFYELYDKKEYREK